MTREAFVYRGRFSRPFVDEKGMNTFCYEPTDYYHAELMLDGKMVGYITRKDRDETLKIAEEWRRKDG